MVGGGAGGRGGSEGEVSVGVEAVSSWSLRTHENPLAIGIFTPEII